MIRNWFTLLTISVLASISASAQMPDMPGMSHDHAPAAQQHLPPASPNDPRAAAAAESLRNSRAQQNAQTGGRADIGDDSLSTHRDAQRLQEAEAETAHTGNELPAPDLLREVAARAPLKLEQFEQWAETHSPTLAQANALAERSRQQGRQAGLPPNPTVGYSGEHIRGGSYHGGEQGAYLQQTIVLGGKLSLRREAYRQQAAADSVGVEEQRLRVLADVQRAFYGALTAQSTAALRQHLLSVALLSVETAHHLANLGQVDSPDVLQAEVEAEQAKIDALSAQREYIARFRMLAAISNQPEMETSPLQGDLEAVPDLQADAAVARVLSESPSIRRAEQQAAAAEARVKSAKRESVPDLKLQAGEWYSGERLDGTGKAAGWMSFAQAGVELPLWNRNQGNTAAAGAEFQRQKADVVRTRLMLRHRAEPVAQQYLTARFQADRYRTQLLPRARRAFELYNMKYQQMAAPYPQVLLSQRTLFSLQIAYLHALEQEWDAAIALDNYTLSGALEAPSSQAWTDTGMNLPTGGAQ